MYGIHLIWEWVESKSISTLNPWARMIQKCQRVGISSLVLIGFSLLGVAGVANAMKPARSPQSSETKHQGQQSDRKPKRAPINFAAAATKLGTTEAKLKTALGLPARPPQKEQTAGEQEPKKPEQRRPRLDIKGAATKLGVTEQKLIEALGLPAKPPGEPGQMSQPK
jgi:hypothetical protein